MSKLSRKNQLLFGSLAGAGQIGKFGSLAAGSPDTTTDPELVQSLSNYLTGWFGAVVGSNSPAIEDMNALCFLYAYQLCYLFQSGIPEWNSQTTYYIGSLVNSNGVIYTSIVDDNLNNALSDTTKWVPRGSNVATVSASGSMDENVDILKVNTAGGAITITLPALASTIGKHKYIKNTGAYPVVVQGNSSDQIDGSNLFYGMTSQYDSIHLFNDGTQWLLL